MVKLGSVFVGMVVLAGSVVAYALDVPPSVPKIWTAKNSVQFALLNSPDSRVAKQRLEMAAATVTQARSGYYPSVDISAQYGQTNNSMYSFGNILNQGAFTPDINFNDPGRTDDLILRAGVEYRLYNGGRDQAGIDAAEAGLAGSGADKEGVLARLAFEAVRSFHSIAQAQEMLEARKASLSAIQASIAVARARYEAGDLLKADLLNLEVQESRASENLILAEHRLELSKKIFLNLLGLKDGSVKISSAEECQQKVPAERGYEKRPELQSLLHTEEAASARLRMAQGGNMPTVDGFASYQYDKGWVMDGSSDSWMAGVKVNYRLFDGYKTTADVTHALAALAAVQEERKKAELAMDLEVKQADLNYRQSIQRLQVTQKMVEQARESARLSRTRFKEGVILSSDLIDVEMRLTDALMRQTVAKVNIKVALADLRRAMGLVQFCEDTEVQ
jgi:outer membrane protein TolC